MVQWGDWWLVGSNHVLSDEVPAAPPEVRAFFCDLTEVTRLHPLVVAVRSIGRDDTGDGYEAGYRIRDRIPFGPFTLPIAYTARIQVPTVGDVYTEARQFPRVRVHGRVSFEEVAGGTRLTERLRIDAPRLLAAATANQAVKAHTTMLAGIRRMFE